MNTKILSEVEPTTDEQGSSSAVPEELRIAVIIGQLDEAAAIERGRRAAQAQTEEERRRVLFDPATPAPPLARPLYWPCRPPPWGEP